jgi:hypothetical protein
MSLACRFCHPDTASSQTSYMSVLMYGSHETINREIYRIEGLKKIVAGHSVYCDVCGRYSVLSYQLTRHMFGEAAEPDQWTYYASLCRSFDTLANMSMV